MSHTVMWSHCHTDMLSHCLIPSLSRQEGSGISPSSIPEMPPHTLNARMTQALREGEEATVHFFNSHVQEVRKTNITCCTF